MTNENSSHITYQIFDMTFCYTIYFHQNWKRQNLYFLLCTIIANFHFFVYGNTQNQLILNGLILHFSKISYKILTNIYLLKTLKVKLLLLRFVLAYKCESFTIFVRRHHRRVLESHTQVELQPPAHPFNALGTHVSRAKERHTPGGEC